MRYSLVFATIAATAIATPYINVEVSEPGELVPENQHNRHENNHRASRNHRNHRNHRDERNRDGRQDDDEDQTGWFSSIWGRHGRNNDRHGRNDRNDRDRHGRRHERNGHRMEEGDQSFSSSNLVDELFGSDFECIIEAETGHAERRGARECCRQVGGELYDVPGRCIFRDVMQNPREEWRDCSMDQEEVFRADCYYREQREVEDELNSRRRTEREENRGDRRRSHSRNDRDREDRDRDSRGNRRNGRDSRRDDRMEQSFLEQSNRRNDRDNRRDSRIECRVELQGDENREQEITRNCCNTEQVDGRLAQNDQRCEINPERRGEREQNQERRADEFEDCAMQQGVPEEQVQCYRVRHNSEL